MEKDQSRTINWQRNIQSLIKKAPSIFSSMGKENWMKRDITGLQVEQAQPLPWLKWPFTKKQILSTG